MKHVENLLRANYDYVAARTNVADDCRSFNFAVITSTDDRIDVFGAPGIHLSDAPIIRSSDWRA